MSTRVLTFPRRVRRLGQHLRPYIATRGTPTAGSVLAYIERMQQYARRQHRSEFERHYAELWRFVFEVTHGTLPNSPAAPVCPAPASEAPAPAAVPPWRRQMLAKPMRKVVAIREQRGRTHGLLAHSWKTVLVLECGHELEELQFTWDQTTPRRRRCKECAK